MVSHVSDRKDSNEKWPGGIALVVWVSAAVAAWGLVALIIYCL